MRSAPKLHSRLAGLTVALLAIFREWTNLLVSSDTRVSNTKTLLVDMPTLLLVLLACLFVTALAGTQGQAQRFHGRGNFWHPAVIAHAVHADLPVVFVVAFL
jgi:hypothetical protein